LIDYGKMSQNAVSAVSYLASQWQGTPRRVSSFEIAEKRRLPRPVVAKILTILSQAGLVKGAPGPGGGYWLAREPRTITLWDVAVLFERTDSDIMCPLGPGWCGTGPHCPLHDGLAELKSCTETFLRGQDFASFQTGAESNPAGFDI
jgi:Rrf2 family protein